MLLCRHVSALAALMAVGSRCNGRLATEELDRVLHAAKRKPALAHAELEQRGVLTSRRLRFQFVVLLKGFT
jgi:hypothetical protein